MAGTNLTTVSNVGISLSSASDNPVTIQSTGGVNVASGLYALAGNSTGFFVPTSFTITNFGGIVSDSAPASFGVTLTGGGTVTNTGFASGYPGFTYSFGTIIAAAHGVAISGGLGAISNSGTI